MKIVNKEFFRKGLEIRGIDWYNTKMNETWKQKHDSQEGSLMKKLLDTKNLPRLVTVLGCTGWLLRMWLYRFAVDAKNLLVRNHPLELLLWLVTAGAAVLIAVKVWKLDGSRAYEDNFRASSWAGMGHFAAAAGILVTVLFAQETTQGSLYALWKGLGILAALALAWAGVSRMQGSRPLFLTHLAACAFLLIHMVGHYRGWSGNPQLQDYVFDLLGCVALTLFAYYETAFDAGMGRRRMQLATGLLAAYFGYVAVSGSQYPLLYAGGVAWALTDLCSLTPKQESGQAS